MATNSSSKNVRSRMTVSLRGSVGTGTKEVESSTGCGPFSLGARFETYELFISSVFLFFLGGGAVNLRY